MNDGALTPAFYVRRGGLSADWWAVLHPPYTLWHLSYVAIGASLVPDIDWLAMGATLLAFFLAVGVAAHAFDERHGRPLGTRISDRCLTVVATLSLSGAVGLGLAGVWYHEALWLLGLIGVGVVFVLGYNLELFGGRLHSDLMFAVAWGGFPILVGLLAQLPPLDIWVVLRGALAVAGAIALSSAQRQLSSPVRLLRRRVESAESRLLMRDGSEVVVSRWGMIAPMERALRCLSWAVPLFALALLFLHL